MAYAFGAPSIVKDGLVFYVDPANKVSWSGPNSSNVNDLINTNNGTIYNDTSGSYGNNFSFTFDGTDDYIEVPNNSILQITDNLTVSSWVYPTNRTGTNTIVDKFYDSSEEIRSWLTRVQNSRFRLTLSNADGSASVNYQTNTALANNVWYYLSFTFSITDNEVNQYVDGVLDSGSPDSKTDLIASNTQPLRIGSGYNLLNDFFGDIGPTLIYNRALSASEVAQNYNALKGRFI